MIIVDEKNRECAEKFSDFDYQYKDQVTFKTRKMTASLVSLSLTAAVPFSAMAVTLPSSVLVADQTEYGAAAYLLNGSDQAATLNSGTINTKTVGVATINGGAATITGSTINVSNTEKASYSLSDSQFPSDYPQSDFYWRYRPFGYSNTADYSAGIIATPSLSGDLQNGVSAFTFTAYRQLGFAAAVFAADGSTQSVSDSTLNVYSENGIALGVVADKVDYSSGAGGGTVNLSGNNVINVNSDGTETGDADGSETFTAVALKTNAKWNIPAGGYGTINVADKLVANTNGAVAVSRGGYINFTNATVTSDSNTQPLYFQTIGGGVITFNGTTLGNNQWEFVGGGIGGASGSLFDLSNLTTGSLTVGNLTGVSPSGVLGGALYDDDGNATGKYAAGDATINLGANNLRVGGANQDGAWSGIIEGTGGSLTKTGTGRLTLSGTNTYDSGTEVDDGTLVRGSENAILTDTTLTVNGGQLDLGDWDFTTSQLSGTGGSVNLNAQNLTVDQAADTSYAGALTGTGSLTKQGTGVLALSGNSSYSGGTTLSAGEIDVGSSTALGSGDLTMAADTTLGFSATDVNLANNILLSDTGTTIDTGSNTGTLSGVISGDQELTKNGSGTLILSGDNTYSGGTALNTGEIAVGHNNALGSGELTMAADTILGFISDKLTLANNVLLNGNGTTIDTNGNSGTLNGIVSGNTALTKTGDGTLVLNGVNTYTGGTNLEAGEIDISNSASLSSGDLTMADDTTLGFTTDNLDLANNITLNGLNSAIATGNYSETLSGVISGVGQISKTGSGTLTLTGNNTYSGGTTLNGGEIAIGNSNALSTGDLTMADTTTLGFTTGDLNLANNVTLSGGTATVDTGSKHQSLSGVISGAGELAKDGSGTLTLTGDNTYTGGTRLSAGEIDVNNNNALGSGTLTMAADTVLGFISDKLALANDLLLSGGTATVATGSNSETLNGTVSGDGKLAKTGNGTLTLTGDNTYTGGTDLTEGKLDVGNNHALGSGSLAMADDTTLGFTTGDLNLANNISLGGLNSSIAIGDYSETLSGDISGAGKIVKNGSGTLTLNGDNSYSGGTTLSGGEIDVGNSNALGSGSLAMADGTTLGFTAGDLNLANAVSLSGTSTVATGSHSETLNGVISGDGGLAKTGSGTLALTGENLYTGGTKLSSGEIDVGSNSALGTGSLGMADGTILGFTTGDLTLANAVSLTGTGTIATGSNNETLSGVISGDGELAKTGSGTLTLSGDNTYTGGTDLNAGEIDVSNNNALGTGSLDMADGTTLGFTTGDLNLANAVALSGTGTIATGSNNETLSGVISGDGGLAKTGSGTLTLSGDNTYTGGTDLNAGEIDVSNNNALGTGSLAMADGTTLGFTTGDLNLANAVTLTGTATIATGSNSETLSGVISGDGTLAKTGSGTLTLTGDSTYTGGTTLSAGEIDVANSHALGTGALAMADNTTLGFTTGGLDLANNISLGGSGSAIATGDYSETLSGDISGAGQIHKTGSGTLTLNGDNSYSGGTTLSGGEIDVGNSNALGTGSLAMTDGTSLGFTASDLNVANNVSLSGTSTVDTGSNSETLSGILSGDAVLAKTGSGTLTLTGDNTFTGGTTVSAGELDAGSNNALGTGAVTLADDSTLGFAADGLTLANSVDLSGTHTTINTNSNSGTLSGVISGDTLTKTGNGTLTLSGDNTYTGGTTLSAGEIDVANSHALGSGTLSMADNTTLGFAAADLTLANDIVLGGANSAIQTGDYNETLSGDISGAGLIDKNGTGTLTLTGNNTYTGGTKISVGEIDIGSSDALSTGPLTMADGTTLGFIAGDLDLANNVTLSGGTATISTGSFNDTLSGVISGDGALAKTGSGTLSLTGDNTYRGGTDLNAGEIDINNSNALGTGTLTMADNTTLGFTTGDLTLANNIVLGGLNSSIATGDYNETLSGDISGTGQIAKTGNGILTLNGDNSYSGGTTLSGGEIEVGNSNALGSGSLAMADGTMLGFSAGDLNLANALSLSGTGTIATGSHSETLSGVISGDGGLSKTGSGTLTLSGDNTYSGGTSLTEGEIDAGSNTALGSSTLTMAANTVLGFINDNLTLANNVLLSGDSATVNTGSHSETLSGVISGDGELAKAGTGTLTLAGENTYTGGTDLTAGEIDVANNNALSSGTLSMADGTSLGFTTGDLNLANAVALTGTGTVATGSHNETLSGVVSGDGTLAKTGSGTLTLGGDNTYTGGTSLSAGEIDVSNNSALGTGSLAMADGTTLGFTTGDLNLANAVALSGTGTIATGSHSETLSGVISGDGGLAKTGSGTLTLSGDNTYSGGTSLSAGEIDVSNNSALGTGSLAMTDGTTLGFTTGDLNLANAVALSGTGTIATGSHSETLSGVISGDGGLAKTGSGTLTLSGENTYSGGTTLSAGEIDLGNNHALGSGSLAMADDTTLGFTTGDLTLANNISLGGLNSVIATGDYSETLSGDISGTGQIAKTGSGTLTLNGDNSYSGGTSLSGGEIDVGNSNALGSGYLVMADGTTLGFTTGDLNLANTVALSGTGTIATGSHSEILSGVISGDGTLTKTGSGTLVLNGDNTYSGGTTLSAGEIDAGSNNALGSSQLSMAADTVLGFVADKLTLANNVLLSGGSATVNTGSNSETLSGVVSGGGTLAKAGSGTLTLSSDNRYTGGTSLSGGEIDVGNSNALGSGSLAMADGTTLGFTATDLNLANTVALNGTGTIATGSHSETLSGVISGKGVLAKTGSGTLVLSGDNTYSGGTTLSAGEIDVSNNSGLGTGNLAMADGTTLGFGASDLSLENTVSLSGTGTIATGSHSETLSGVISGKGVLAKTGSGTLTLSGGNTYSGGTTLSTGEINVSNNSALGTGNLAMADGTTLGFTTGDLSLANNISLGGLKASIATGDYSETLSGDISGAGQMIKTGSGTLTLNGDNSYSGGTTLSGGEIDAGNSNALGSGSLAMADSTTLGFSAGDLNLANAVSLTGTGTLATGSHSETLSGVISGDGGLAKTGSGKLILSGDNTYSGGTELSAGEIDLANSSALGSGTLTMLKNTVLGFVTDKLQLANNILLNGVNTLFKTGSNTETLSGTVSGEGELAKNGSGTLILTGDNTYSGGTLLSEGEIDAGSNSALGSGQLSMANNTTLGFVANGLKLANNVALTGDSAIINTGSYSETLSGVISGDGELHKTGSGTLTLNGDSTYSGGTLVSAGRVNTATSDALGTGTISLADGTTLGFAADNLILANNIAFTGDQDPTIDTGAYTATLAGDISGAADLTKTGSGTLITTGANNTYSGATTVAEGTLQAGSAGTFSSASAYKVDSGATLDLNSYSQTVSSLSNSGLVSLSHSGSAGTTLTVNGDYTGDNGTLSLNTVLGGDDSLTDKLIITGAASGTTSVVVNNSNGSGAQTLEGIEVIETGSSTANAFVQNGRIVAGAYDYHLQQGNASGANTSDWYLTSTPSGHTGTDTGGNTGTDTGGNTGNEVHTYRPEAASYTANLAAANTMFSTTLHDRLGETQYTDALTGEKKVTSMWMRNLGSHNKFSMSDGQNKTSANRYVLQIGGDIAQWSASGLDRFHVGVMGGYGNQHSNSHNSLTGYDSKGDIHGYSAGLYGTWYQNDADKTGLYVDSWALYNWFDNDVQGQGLASESYKSKGFTASVESGYTFHAGSYESAYGMTNDFYIQPQVQLTWMGVKSKDHTESNGTLVQGTGNDNLQARVGTRFYLKGKSALDKNTQREFEPFVEANWIYNTQQYGTRMNGISDDSQGSRNIGEVKAGVEAKINNRLNLWTTVSQQVGGHGYSNTQGAVGLKYMF